jgi:hypothetical protein
MTTKLQTKLVHVGEFIAEVDVQLMIEDDEWSPYLSVDDAMKLDEVRDLLRKSDIESASKLARVFRLVPVAA